MSHVIALCVFWLGNRPCLDAYQLYGTLHLKTQLALPWRLWVIRATWLRPRPVLTRIAPHTSSLLVCNKESNSTSEVEAVTVVCFLEASRSNHQIAGRCSPDHSYDQGSWYSKYLLLLRIPNWSGKCRPRSLNAPDLTLLLNTEFLDVS